MVLKITHSYVTNYQRVNMVNQMTHHVFLRTSIPIHPHHWSITSMFATGQPVGVYGVTAYPILRHTQISHQCYPLVNIQKTMERSTIFNGKIHYFYGHFQ